MQSTYIDRNTIACGCGGTHYQGKLSKIRIMDGKSRSQSTIAERDMRSHNEIKNQLMCGIVLPFWSATKDKMTTGLMSANEVLSSISARSNYHGYEAYLIDKLVTVYEPMLLAQLLPLVEHNSLIYCVLIHCICKNSILHRHKDDS